MKEFFRGRRRKFGGGTLVMACVFLGGWVRSQTIIDYFEFKNSPTSARHFVKSEAGVLFFEVAPDLSITWMPEWQSGAFTQGRMLDYYETIDKAWDLRNGPFGIGESIHNYAEGTIFAHGYFVFFPYWCIITPLTVVSAYLLLGKPRPAKPKAESLS